MKSSGEHLGEQISSPGPLFEVLTAEELASLGASNGEFVEEEKE